MRPGHKWKFRSLNVDYEGVRYGVTVVDFCGGG
jgi:hypothetical protein